MRTLRSRNVQQSDSDTCENKSEDVEYNSEESVLRKMKKKKYKKQTSDENEEHLDAVPEEKVFKAKKLKKKKRSIESNKTEELNSSINIESKSEISNDNINQKERVRTRKFKKARRQVRDEIEASMDKPHYIAETDLEERKKKRELRKLKKVTTNNKVIYSENASEAENLEEHGKRKKCSKTKNSKNTSAIVDESDIFHTSTETSDGNIERPKMKNGRKREEKAAIDINGINDVSKPRKPKKIEKENKITKDDNVTLKSRKSEKIENEIKLNPRKLGNIKTDTTISTENNVSKNSVISILSKSRKSKNFQKVNEISVEHNNSKQFENEVGRNSSEHYLNETEQNSSSKLMKSSRETNKYSPKFSTAITSTLLMSRKSKVIEENNQNQYESNQTFEIPKTEAEKYLDETKFVKSLKNTNNCSPKFSISETGTDDLGKFVKNHKTSRKSDLIFQKRNTPDSITKNTSLNTKGNLNESHNSSDAFTKSGKTRYSPKFSTAITSTAVKSTKSKENEITEEDDLNESENNILSNKRHTFEIPKNVAENYFDETKFIKPSRDTNKYSPKFSTAVTSTAIKLQKPENSETEIDDSGKFVKNRKTLRKSELICQKRDTLDTEGNLNETHNLSTVFYKSSKNRYSPKFSTAITSTAVKPKRPENFEKDQFEILLENENDELARSHHSSRINSEILNETVTLNKSDKNRKRSTENRDSASNRSEISNKVSKLILNNTQSIIAISDSPENSNIKQNKTSMIESEMVYNADRSNNSKKIKNSDSTFDKLPKKRILDESIITISDSPDTTIKQNTFNETDTLEPEITSDEDSITPKNLSNSSKISNSNKSNRSSNKNSVLNTMKQSTFNKTKILEPEITSDEDSITTKDSVNTSLISNKSKRSSTKSDAIPNRRDTFEKITNISKSKNSPSETSISIKDAEKSERISDVSESILKSVNNISFSPEKTQFKRKTRSIFDTPKDEVANSSGDWKIESNLPESEENLNETFEITDKDNDNSYDNGAIENSTVTQLKNENTFSPRRKWLKFPRNSIDAESVLESISSPKLQKQLKTQKIVQKLMKTPKELYKLQKPSTTPNLSVKKSATKPIKKLITSNSSKKTPKRLAMPNFALIHQKAFEKMENIKEYSDRKKERAQILLNPGSELKSATKTQETKGTSSRQLFTNKENEIEKETKIDKDNKKKVMKGDSKFNRFGFKVVDLKPSHIPVSKPVIKPSIFARSEVVTIANKNKIVSNNRENRRGMLKGVRTNRRFDLLMQMRNK